jgi:hypothetical protein
MMAKLRETLSVGPLQPDYLLTRSAYSSNLSTLLRPATVGEVRQSGWSS